MNNFNNVQNGTALLNNNQQEQVSMNSTMRNNSYYNPRPSSIEEMIALDDFLQKELQNVLNYLFHRYPKEYLVPLYKRKPRCQQFVDYNMRHVPLEESSSQNCFVYNPSSCVPQEIQGTFPNLYNNTAARENNYTNSHHVEEKSAEELQDLKNYCDRHPMHPFIFEEGYSSEDSHNEDNFDNVTLDFYNTAALQMMQNDNLQVGSSYSHENTLSNSAFNTGAIPKVRPQNTFADYFTDGLLNEMNARLSAKTKICRNYALSGDCSYGQKCQFAHGHVELRSPRHLPNYKTRKCNTFHYTGFCEYGIHCRYIHYSDATPHLSPIQESVPFELKDNDSEWPHLPAQIQKTKPMKNKRNKNGKTKKSANEASV